MAGRRSYQDPCGVARALDMVGERWALLVVRELLLGPKRFTDLRAGLPSASQNVLAQRLRDLELADLVRRRKLGPPVGASVYELTERGRELEPVLIQLARFGSRLPLSAPDDPSNTAGELSADALILALRTTYQPAADQPELRLELQLGDDRFDAEVAGDRVQLTRAPTEAPTGRPTTRITAGVATLRAVVFGGVALADAEQAGALRIEGDRAAAASFVMLFPRPTPYG